MTVFQLDQCLNNRRLAKDCNDEGLAGVWRFPSELAQQPTSDPEMLARFMAADRPLLTTDGRLPWEHTSHIPNPHPGIVVIRSNAKHTLRIEDARRILAGCKARLPEWHQLSFRNSILELWPDALDVYHVVRKQLHLDQHCSFDEVDWPQAFIASLTTNSNRPL